MKDATTFLAAIRETTKSEYDEGAVAYLEALVDEIRGGLTTRGIEGRARDHWIFFEGMLKGMQLRLKRHAMAAEEELKDRGVRTDN